MSLIRFVIVKIYKSNDGLKYPNTDLDIDESCERITRDQINIDNFMDNYPSDNLVDLECGIWYMCQWTEDEHYGDFGNVRMRINSGPLLYHGGIIDRVGRDNFLVLYKINK